MNVSAAGDRGLLVEFGSIDAPSLHGAAARARTLPGVRACVPGHSSLLVLFDGPPREADLVDALQSGVAVASSSQRHVLEVSFHDSDAPDLPEFLGRVGLSRDAFLERVGSLSLIARYIGFRGGFAYLDGWPADWAMPRRATSRPVKAGSFAIAGAVAGFYPIDSPGGWNVLGRTGASLENAIAPGDEIRIVPVEDRPTSEAARTRLPLLHLPGIEILGAPLSLVTDRPFDEELAAAANRAVGNAAGVPLLECAMAGPRIRATQDVVVAWSDLEVRALRTGEIAEFGRVGDGLRGYLAVGRTRGDVRKLARSDRLRIAAIAGPHRTPLREIECVVTGQLDRVGIRMQPVRPLGVSAPADLPSCGMQCGTLQLHPDGSVIAMGPDHPVTGGYLQPMTVVTGERWKLAQLAPGDRVTFVAYSP